MTDPTDRLEAELRAMRPREVSVELRACIARELASETSRGSIRRRMAVGLALAATVVLAVTVALFLRPYRQPVTSAHVYAQQDARIIAREAAAATLLAAARSLDGQPGGETYATEAYRYIHEAYGDTEAAQSLPSRENP